MLLCYNGNMENIWDKISRMYREKRQISLLTWTYLSVAIVAVIVAGLIALVSQPTGVALLVVPVVAVAAMLANVIVWALIRFIIESHEQNEKSKARTEKQTSKLVDKYKGLSNEDIIADLDKTRIPLEIAIENLAHDFNIGSIVRNANAFNVSRVHIIGKRKYNRRGAMVTDKYLHIDHFATADEFVEDARVRGMLIVAVDNNRPESRPLAKTKLHENSILVFGSESDGISQELLDKSDQAFYIEQLGSTRSINVGCASAIAMYEAVRRLGFLPKDA